MRPTGPAPTLPNLLRGQVGGWRGPTHAALVHAAEGFAAHALARDHQTKSRISFLAAHHPRELRTVAAQTATASPIPRAARRASTDSDKTEGRQEARSPKGEHWTVGAAQSIPHR